MLESVSFSYVVPSKSNYGFTVQGCRNQMIDVNNGFAAGCEATALPRRQLLLYDLGCAPGTSWAPLAPLYYALT